MKEKGQSLVEQALALVVFLIFVLFMVNALGDMFEVVLFDHQFDNHMLEINSKIIPIGSESVSTPFVTTLTDIPTFKGDGLNRHPRSWTLNPCVEVQLKSWMRNLHAAAPQETANMISIQMPLTGGKTVLVCAPPNVITQVFLWGD